MFENFHGVLTGVSTCQSVEHCQPNVVTYHYDCNYHQEYRQLFSNAAFVRKCTEGASDEYGKQRNNNASYDCENDFLEFFQAFGDGSGVSPSCSQTNQYGEYQCAHYAHNRSNFQIKEQFRQIFQTIYRRGDVQRRNNAVTSKGGEERCTDGGYISQNNCETQHSASVFTQAGNGRCDKANDNQRYAEHNNIAEEVFTGKDHLH